MPTLEIGGKRVQVGDEFLKLTPEQQNATVDEIAKSLGIGGGDQPTAAPAAAPISDRVSGPVQTTQKGDGNILDMLNTVGNNIASGVPIIGPTLENIGNNVDAAWASMLEGKPVTASDRAQVNADLNQKYPAAAVTGQVVGAVAPFLGAAKIPAAAKALGLSGPLGQRVLFGGLSQAAISGADAMARGQPLDQAVGSAEVGGGIGAAIPLLGAGLNVAARAGVNAARPLAGAIFSPAKEAMRRTGSAFLRDAGTGMTAAESAVAESAGIPLMNVDRGGETVRALARSVANQSPEARAVITRTAQDRFTSQAGRAVDFIRKLTGGSVDDIARREAILNTGRATNAAAYKAAESAPGAQAIWTPEIQQLMQAPEFQAAVRTATGAAKTDAALNGFKAVQNPFIFARDGSVSLKPGVYPSLQFWDIVQRNLRRAAENLPATAKYDRAQIGQLRSQLLSVLDNAVPQFQAARQGAAGFFGAENALDAGRQYATQLRAVPEAKAAFAKFNATEKQDFATGFASSLIDQIKAAGDHTNVIKSVFEKPAMREMVELAFGSAKARQLEAYVRVEGLADAIRGALGNSTTARQLAEMGIGAFGGGLSTGWDWKGILGGAALARGGRFLVGKADQRVMQRVAALLTSGDKADLQRAINNAAMSEAWMDSLKSISNLLEAVSRGTALATQ